MLLWGFPSQVALCWCMRTFKEAHCSFTYKLKLSWCSFEFWLCHSVSYVPVKLWVVTTGVMWLSTTAWMVPSNGHRLLLIFTVSVQVIRYFCISSFTLKKNQKMWCLFIICKVYNSTKWGFIVQLNNVIS